jgi:hypothetical protein
MTKQRLEQLKRDHRLGVVHRELITEIERCWKELAELRHLKASLDDEFERLTGKRPANDFSPKR